MIELDVSDRSGTVRRISAETGISLIEVLRDSGMDELLALCGGCCSCATCHVFIKGGGEGATAFGSDDENDILDSSDHRRPNSRLSCQLKLGEEHRGMMVRIAPEDCAGWPML